MNNDESFCPICEKWWDIIHKAAQPAIDADEQEHLLTALMHNAAVLASTASPTKEARNAIVTVFAEMLEGEAERFANFRRKQREH